MPWAIVARSIPSVDANRVGATVLEKLYFVDSVAVRKRLAHSIAEGELEETTIVCPCHGSEFDVRTGEVVNPPARDPVGSYPVTVEDGQIRIEI